MSKAFERLPEPASTVNSVTILLRMVDALGFRYRWAVEGLQDKNLEFRPVESSMDLLELMKHIHFLCSRIELCFTSRESFPDQPENLDTLITQTLGMLENTRNGIAGMKEPDLEKCHVIRKGTGEKIPFWYFINGPLADALTHVGQITTWRRVMGNPVLKSNPFLGLPPEPGAN